MASCEKIFLRHHSVTPALMWCPPWVKLIYGTLARPDVLNLARADVLNYARPLRAVPGQGGKVFASEEMLAAKFCYAPYGHSTGSSGRYLNALLYGCVPVFWVSLRD